MVGASDFRYYVLKNRHQDDTIYPIVYDAKDSKKLWDGSGNDHEVSPGSEIRFDFNNFSNSGSKIPDQTEVILGCKVKGSDKEVKDSSRPRTYVNTSQRATVGTFFQNQVFSIDFATVLGLDAATPPDANLKFDNVAVAKLLAALANFISPELA